MDLIYLFSEKDFGRRYTASETVCGPTENRLFLKVIYHPLYSMNNFVTNKSKLPQDGAQVFPYMGWLVIM